MSPRCTRTRDAWRTRRAPGEPALNPHAGRVAHPEGTRWPHATHTRGARGAPERVFHTFSRKRFQAELFLMTKPSVTPLA